MSDFKPNFLNKYIDRNLPTISISKVLEMIQEPFDQIGVATKTHDKHFNNPLEKCEFVVYNMCVKLYLYIF